MVEVLSRRKLPLVLAAGVLLLGLLVLLSSIGRSEAIATHKPADKVVASGSTVEVVSPAEEVTILSGILRSSAPSDLLLSVTSECAITTDVKTEGNDDQMAEGVVKVWVEIDGEAVGINNIPTSTTSAEAQDDGKVVFCNRSYRRKTTLFDDEDATIETFFRTREANAFNWVALNVGNGTHEVAVKATLTETATNKATADAAVGNRTLVVEPAKLANDAGV